MTGLQLLSAMRNRDTVFLLKPLAFMLSEGAKKIVDEAKKKGMSHQVEQFKISWKLLNFK
jgi:hypothetical protein